MVGYDQTFTSILLPLSTQRNQNKVLAHAPWEKKVEITVLVFTLMQLFVNSVSFNVLLPSGCEFCC